MDSLSHFSKISTNAGFSMLSAFLTFSLCCGLVHSEVVTYPNPSGIKPSEQRAIKVVQNGDTKLLSD